MTPSPAGVDTEELEPRRRQSDGADLPVLPDSCNLGTVLRVLVCINVGALLLAAVVASADHGFFDRLLQIAAIVEPATLASLLVLCPLRRYVNGRSRWIQYGVGTGVPALATLVLSLALEGLLAPDSRPPDGF